MHLEELITNLTSAIEELTVVIRSTGMGAAEDDGEETSGDQPVVTKRKRRTKAEMQAARDAEAATNAPADTGAGYKLDEATGVKIATRPWFFELPAKDVVYSINAGEPLTILDGSTEITADKFASERERLQKKHAHLAAAGKPSDTVGNVATVAGAQDTLAAQASSQSNSSPTAAPDTTSANSPTTSGAAADQAAGDPLLGDPLLGGADPLLGGAPVEVPLISFQEASAALLKAAQAGKRTEVMAKLAEVGAKDFPSLQTKGQAVWSAVAAHVAAL